MRPFSERRLIAEQGPSLAYKCTLPGFGKFDKSSSGPRLQNRTQRRSFPIVFFFSIEICLFTRLLHFTKYRRKQVLLQTFLKPPGLQAASCPLCIRWVQDQQYAMRQRLLAGLELLSCRSPSPYGQLWGWGPKQCLRSA